MATKTIGILLIVLMCFILLPVGIGIIGGLFGVIFGLIGGIFGALFGIIGGVFGAVFGFIGWLFETLFCWDFDFPFLDINIFTLIVLVAVVALISKANQPKSKFRK